MNLSLILQNDMTHFEQYNQIIDFRKSNPLPEDQYGEKHHIVPKSICPILKDSSENIVRLSAQEHFLAHYHLWLAYRDELHEKKWAKKMCFAFHRMKQQLLKCDDVESMAKLYEEVRIEFSKNISEIQKGKSRPTMKGRKPWITGKHLSADTKQKLSKKLKGKWSYLKGKKLSEETKAKISTSLCGHKNHFGHKHSEETKKKLAERHWYNNCLVSVFAKTCPEGFVRGRLSKKRSK